MVALKTLEVRLNERGQILKQFGKVCDALGKGGANRIMTMALNKEMTAAAAPRSARRCGSRLASSPKPTRLQ